MIGLNQSSNDPLDISLVIVRHKLASAQSRSKIGAPKVKPLPHPLLITPLTHLNWGDEEFEEARVIPACVELFAFDAALSGGFAFQ